MDYKHCCVIDAQNRYKTLVLAVNEPDESGDAQEKIQYYRSAPAFVPSVWEK